jgi:hypothetical protein
VRNFSQLPSEAHRQPGDGGTIHAERAEPPETA